MALSRPNRSDATGTKNRTPNSVTSGGLCAVCVDSCPGLCEVGRSAIRSTEMLYPQPFGTTSFSSEKDYPVDFSHFNIMGTTVGAEGIDADSDLAIFPNVNTELEVGSGSDRIKLKLPVIIGAMGSTKVAGVNWDGLAIGAALSGVIISIGENVAGMDPQMELKNGRLVKSPELERRIKLFRDWWDGYGTIAVQANVEDTRIGVQEYVIDKLGVEAVELKWGQGAKNIGGEVKVNSLEQAVELKKAGYIVLPDPENPMIQESYRNGAITKFERHSRVGMVTEEEFKQKVEDLRKAGAKFIFLKTGAYRPSDLARAIKYSSDARLDLLIVDGAGGGTGMSPWRMMNEWGVPTVALEAQVYRMMEILKDRGAYLPPVAMAGGFALEDQIYKGLALGAPFVKMIEMARAPLSAAMVGKTVGGRLEDDDLPPVYRVFGPRKAQVFAASIPLKAKYGDDFEKIPYGALGVYGYFQRLHQGLTQLMCGARKFNLSYISRDDLAALTMESANLTGIKYINDIDTEEFLKILNS